MDHPSTDAANRCETNEDCDSGKRNRYFRGKRMDAAQLQLEQRYIVERRRLINRAVHGHGVVAGYRLEVPGTEGARGVRIHPGLAFDHHGRELLLCSPTALHGRNTFIVDPGDTGLRSLDKAAPGQYLLRVHYAERATGDTMVGRACDCGSVEKDYACESVVFSLEHLCCDDDTPCGEPDCERECHCAAAGDACAEAGRGPHACLCQWSAATTVACASGPLCSWHGWTIDPGAGEALARVTVERTQDPCDPVVVRAVEDDCGPRRLVKGNEMLYDLLRGCDLTRIAWISWGRWHRNPEAMAWPDFATLIGPGPASDQDTAALTAFAIRFNGPVRRSTVTPDCFTLRFLLSHADSGWFDSRPVVIPQLELAPPDAGDPADSTREVRLWVDAAWFSEVMDPRASIFRSEGSRVVQIEVHGDYILDCHGQPVDANANGFALRDSGGGRPPPPSGNGTPGGTFLSTFRIAQRPPAATQTNRRTT